MHSLHFSSFSQVYAPLTEISDVDKDEPIDIPLPINLQGKYLISTYHEAKYKGCSFLMGRMNEIWNRTVGGFPFNPRVSTLTFLGITLSSLSEILYSTLASFSTGPVPPLWVDLTCSGLALCSLGIVTYRCLQANNIEKDPYKKIDHYLQWLKKNFYFLELWEEINRDVKLTFKVITIEEAQKEHYVSEAWYSANQHTITLVKEVDDYDFLYAIIFECCNAFQRQRFIKFHSKIGWDNIPNRNKYGVLLEQLEHQSTITYYKIVKYGVEKLEWNSNLLRGYDQERDTVMSFEKIYSHTNKLLPGKKVSHTESYRLCWDKVYAPTFFLKHSENLEKHPKLLNYRSSPENKTLLNLVVWDCLKLIRIGNANTQEEIIIALIAFIDRWFAEKQRLNIQNSFEDLSDSHILFWGYLYIISSLQKKDQSEAFIAQVDSLLWGEKMNEVLILYLDLQNINRSILNHFDSLLKMIAQKIIEEHKPIPHDALTDFTLKPEQILLIEDEKEKKDIICVLSIRMLEILDSLSVLIQREIAHYNGN